MDETINTPSQLAYLIYIVYHEIVYYVLYIDPFYDLQNPFVLFVGILYNIQHTLRHFFYTSWQIQLAIPLDHHTYNIF